MSLFKKSNRTGGFMDEIRCDEPTYLIWKWHPEGTKSGTDYRENAIRYGSSLRVKDGEVAVFVYKQTDEVMQDFIIGPFDKKIETKNFPVLASLVGLAYEGGTPFQAEIYFINLAQIIQTKFGVPFFDVFDPRFSDYSVPIAVRGTISFKIKDYEEFIKLHRLIDFDLNTFQLQIRDAVVRYVKDIVTNAPAEHNIPLIKLESKISQINDVVEILIKERLFEDFGVDATSVDISAIEIDKDSEGYHSLLKITKNIEGAVIKAEAETKIKDIYAKQRIEEEHYEETLRIQREEAQYAQHMQTQSSHLGAFQIEKQAEVGIAGAEALGQMGSNGGTNVNLGSGEGINMGAIMAGMAIGGTVGQNIAGAMNGMMNFNNGVSAMPPLPGSVYYIVVNDNAEGPFNISALKQMITTKQFQASTYVWKEGMMDWVVASEVDELKDLFNNSMPPLPKK